MGFYGPFEAFRQNPCPGSRFQHSHVHCLTRCIRPQSLVLVTEMQAAENCIGLRVLVGSIANMAALSIIFDCGLCASTCMFPLTETHVCRITVLQPAQQPSLSRRPTGCLVTPYLACSAPWDMHHVTYPVNGQRFFPGVASGPSTVNCMQPCLSTDNSVHVRGLLLERAACLRQNLNKSQMNHKIGAIYHVILYSREGVWTTAQALPRLNATFASMGLPSVAIRIGLHTGEP